MAGKVLNINCLKQIPGIYRGNRPEVRNYNPEFQESGTYVNYYREAM